MVLGRNGRGDELAHLPCSKIAWKWAAVLFSPHIFLFLLLIFTDLWCFPSPRQTALNLNYCLNEWLIEHFWKKECFVKESELNSRRSKYLPADTELCQKGTSITHFAFLLHCGGLYQHDLSTVCCEHRACKGLVIIAQLIHGNSLKPHQLNHVHLVHESHPQCPKTTLRGFCGYRGGSKITICFISFKWKQYQIDYKKLSS